MDVVEYIQNCFKLYLADSSAYKYIDKKVDWVVGYITIVVLSLISTAISFAINPALKTELLIGIGGTILGLTVGIFIGYGIMHLFFKLFGGQASFQDFIKFGFSLAVFPSLFSLIFAFIPQSLYLENTYAAIVVGIINLFIAIWAIVISIRTYAKITKLSYGKTILAMLMPIIILLVLGLIIGVIVGLAFMG